MAKTNRFSALRQLREQRQELDKESLPEQGSSQTPKSKRKRVPKKKNAPVKPVEADQETEKKKPGRPRGRRSNPEYTQISAYIPLELLLSVQERLADERRESKQRTARPVSALMEELLRQWLK